MNEIKLPEQLQGAWEHALILTYGANIPFFENALWGQFAASCRNKIILADGGQYLNHCVEWARSGAVHFMNQRYVAEGVFAPRAAHAKMILLTNSKAGRLLVGSGNLGMDGYASGGELFTQYDYSAEAPEHLGAFLAAWELVEGMLARGYIAGPQTRRRIDHLLKRTEWLMSAAPDGWRPVRHNLTQSFLDQLRAAVGGRQVEELWILSPFYDPEAAALERLLAALQPQRAVVLVQTGATSVDPSSLQRVRDRCGGQCEVRPVSKGKDIPYIHAKLYLARLPDAAICLQGSPNLSQVAMLLPVPHGNIELANLLQGPRNAFDHLLAALHIGPPVTDLSTLNLTCDPIAPPPPELSVGWQLVGGEWHDDRLYLRFLGDLPDLASAELVIAGRAFPLDVLSQQHGTIEVRLPHDATALMGRPVPLLLRRGQGGGELITNPVFICNNAALEQELEDHETTDRLPKIGSLELDDVEIEQLLGELDAALVIDRRSIWQVAGCTPPEQSGDDDEGLRIDYINVDYELLRRHPRVQQYIAIRTGTGSYRPTRLQIILNAIVDHFRVLLTTPPGASAPPSIAGLDEIEGNTEEERDRNAGERQRRQQSVAQRIRRILKSFIRRYLRGLGSPDFQKVAGFEVMAQNYGIFSYLLWRLFARDWVEPEFLAESLLETWTFFWGTSQQSGYFWRLDSEEQALVRAWLTEQYGDGQLLAALAWSASILASNSQEKLHFALRDFWRAFLVHPPYAPTAQAMEVAWRSLADLLPYETLSPSHIIGDLARLAEFETRDSFLRAMERRHRCPDRSWRFAKAKVARPSFPRGVNVDCLVIPMCDALANQGMATEILQAWMRWENQDYYRIASPDSNKAQRLIFYDKAASYGMYRTDDQSAGPTLIISVPSTPAPWDGIFSQLRALAADLETQITFPAARERAGASHANHLATRPPLNT